MFSPTRTETSRRYDEVLLPVLLYCEEHLQEPLSLAELAGVAGFLPHHFHRIFHHVVGEAPKAYLRRLRLERAVYRLKVTPDSVLQIALERTPARHLLFVRHKGYEKLLAGGKSFLSLWDDLFAYAGANGIGYSPEVLVGITHDDPYVTDEPHIRFDACLPVDGPLKASYPVGYRYAKAGLCVARRHAGCLEEMAKTFAHIGVSWLPSGGYGLRAASPFEVYHCKRAADGRLELRYADAYVPLELTKRPKEKHDERLSVQ